jgi:hypothetical protein
VEWQKAFEVSFVAFIEAFIVAGRAISLAFTTKWLSSHYLWIPQTGLLNCLHAL